jgi:D-lactate dehydrogenase
MTTYFFSSKPYEQAPFAQANAAHGFTFIFGEAPLNAQNAALAQGAEAVCIFVNDRADAPALAKLATQGCRLVALRCAGYNQVDLAAAAQLGLRVARVPEYSPYAVAEHTVALMLTLNRRTHRAYNRVKEGNFALDGLMGFDFYGKTVALVGLGKIGLATAKILRGFGCRVLGHDPSPSPEARALGIEFGPLDQVLGQAQVVSLHCPLTPQTHHLINADRLARMQPGVMLINTSRGGLVDTHAAIQALKNGKIGYLGLDVYEEESSLFFRDLSGTIIQDDVFMRLLTFPNVLITGHQAFFTREAMQNIADTTVQNLAAFAAGQPLANEVRAV